MNKRWLIIPLLLLAAGGAAAYAYIQLRPQTDPNVLRVSGNIEVTDIEVSFRIPGWSKRDPSPRARQSRSGS